MNIFREIQKDAASDIVAASTLLRKCILLTTKVNVSRFSQWLQLELEGYPDSNNLPEYRLLRGVHVYGEFSNGRTILPKVEIRNGDLSATERVYGHTAHYQSGLMLCEESISRVRDGVVYNVIPVAALPYMHLNQSGMGECVRAWSECPVGKYLNVIASVRRQVLDFTIIMERQHPDIDKVVADKTDVISSSIYNQHFHGEIGNLAINSQNFSQNATLGLHTTKKLTVDLHFLAIELPRLRLALVEDAEPEQLIAASEVRKAEKELTAPQPDQSEVQKYLGRAGRVAYDVAVKIGAAAAVEAIKQSMEMCKHN